MPLAPLNGTLAAGGVQPVSGISRLSRKWDDAPCSQESNAYSDWSLSPDAKAGQRSSGPPDTMPIKKFGAKLEALKTGFTASQEKLQASRKESAEAVFRATGGRFEGGTLKRKSDLEEDQPRKRPNTKPWDVDHTKMKLQSSEVPTSAVSAKAAVKERTSLNVALSSEQNKIADVVKTGVNVFFTGSAGTGKSVLLRRIIQTMKEKYQKIPEAVAVTAPTGVAACNIGGSTIHSFGGIGLGIDSASQLAARIKKNQKALVRWTRTRILIIDEVSMLDGDLFDKLESIARILRKNPKPFGGIQLVITGDFFQLPPVSKGGVKFAFQAEGWTKCVDRTFNLTQVFRQKEQGFVTVLNEMRLGHMSPRSINLFSGLSRPLSSDGVEPTELFPRREDVDRANQTRIDRLATEMLIFRATDGGVADERSRASMLGNFMAMPTLQLKIDAQVMMIKNVDDTLVNGSVGKVTAFMTEQEWFASRGGADPMGNNSAKKTISGSRFPVVNFKVPGQTGKYRDELVRPETFKVEAPNGQIEASRLQLPLVLAWAMSIHKSQGQTLEKVKVDLRRVFEKGQAYVAISRATSLQGLQIQGFEPSKVMAHPAVIAWCKGLETVS